MKFLIITSLIAASFASILQVNKCLINNCSSQLQKCNENAACEQSVSDCSTRCNNQECYENCLYGSGLSDDLLVCAETSSCFVGENKPCPTYCGPLVDGGADDCAKKEQPYPTDTCVVNYLTTKGYTQCDDKNCVCSKATVFVAGLKNNYLRNSQKNMQQSKQSHHQVFPPQPYILDYTYNQVPTITVNPPPNNDVEWFYQENGLWKQFDWRRCNILENMLHHNSDEFQMIYRDEPCIINYEIMMMRSGEQTFKLRRETSIASKQIRIGYGKWSYYNGTTWVEYDKQIEKQLEDLMPKQEQLIIMYVQNKQYMFDLDQNVQVEPGDGKIRRKIITRQWMTNQQLQEYGRQRKKESIGRLCQNEQYKQVKKKKSKQGYNENNTTTFRSKEVGRMDIID
ncbi:hypothetical protein pb186bvf_017195 [Paramecium bursaria]